MRAVGQKAESRKHELRRGLFELLEADDKPLK